MKQALFIASFADLTRPQVTSPAHSTGDTAVTDQVSPAPEQGCPAHSPPALSGPLTASVTTALSLPLSATASPRQMQAGPGFPSPHAPSPLPTGLSATCPRDHKARTGIAPPTFPGPTSRPDPGTAVPPGPEGGPRRTTSDPATRTPLSAKLRATRSSRPHRADPAPARAEAPGSSHHEACESGRDEAGPMLHRRRGSPRNQEGCGGRKTTFPVAPRALGCLEQSNPFIAAE
ncbi:uncharacterized protein LOC125964771 [Orcinus orca]|uniref:uncharacterized protein LOC125964771 n=1 Tax=Orcinus orca TaxID=9733 RepID=UPI002112F930|nr:uncharacterized protein LOC125964771 [Orcinus orca]